jgi:UDP-N-acetylglucosamine--N-acetylmuramyl-(pentapeptide) pyrophosphoryl-undecaprenol N-acetylglucosamine transferase
VPSGAQILWQTGAAKYEEIIGKLSPLSKRVKIVPFIRPMSEAYAIADVVVARSGALTLSEIAVAGLPSILIPYPYAAADHQRKNSETFANAGAAKVILDRELDGAKLSEALFEILNDKNLRAKMSEGAKTLARPNALKDIADEIERIALKES